MNDDQVAASVAPAAPAIAAATLARIRAEESARLEVRDALTPRTPRSTFDKAVALSNTNIGIGTIGAIVIGIAGWTWTQVDDRIHRSERSAEHARVRALSDIQNVTPFLAMLAKADSPERLLACRAIAHMIATHAINDELGQSLATEAGHCLAATLKHASGVDTASAAENRAAAQAVAGALSPASSVGVKTEANAAATASALSNAPLALARALPKRVYIQIADASQKPIADALRASYEKQGWIVPLTQTVGTNAPNALQVRYFNDSDAEGAAHTLELIDSMPDAKTLPHASPTVRRFDLKAPPGQIEVWLPSAR